MPLKIKKALCSEVDCKSFFFYDKTGVYSPANTGGYGNPNEALTDITNYMLRVWFPGAKDYVQVNLKQLAVEQGVIFPNTEDSPVKITSEKLGLAPGSVLPDGRYYVEVIANGLFNSEPFEYSMAGWQMIICNTACCIDKLALAVNPDCENCFEQDENASKAMEIYFLLLWSAMAVNCNKLNRADNFLRKAQSLCNDKCRNC